MRLPEICIRRPVFATVMSLMITLVGAVAYDRLTVREYPRIEEPVVTVRTDYPGATPESIDAQITAVIESAVSRVQGDLVRVRLSSIPSFWLVDRVALAAESAAPVVVQEVQLTSASDSTGQDLRPLLRHFDERTYRMTRGTVAELSFPDPPRTAGLERTYLARTSGWYRIGCDTTRTPDHALLTRLAGEPHAAAHIAVERANQALQYAEEVLR